MIVRTVTARVVLAITLYVPDDAKDHDGTPLTDEAAVDLAMGAMLLNDQIGLNPEDTDDMETFSTLAWNEPNVVEIEVTS